MTHDKEIKPTGSIEGELYRQRKDQTEIHIKRLIQGAKLIDLSIVDEIISENDAHSMFDLTGQSEKISDSMLAVKQFCNKIRNIK